MVRELKARFSLMFKRQKEEPKLSRVVVYWIKSQSVGYSAGVSSEKPDVVMTVGFLNLGLLCLFYFVFDLFSLDDM